MIRATCWGVLLVAALAWGNEIPLRPMGDEYTLDQAGLLTREDELAVAGYQLEALRQYNSPIVVVTVARVSDYGETSVEALATRWFNQWQIGTLGLQGGANQGILLLVAVQDRRARIELGADWGHDWDTHAKRIMDGTIVPRFKSGDYSGGIVAGVKELRDMAKTGKNSHPPGNFLEDRVRPLCKYSVLDPMPFLVLMGIGFVLTLLGIFPRFNKWIFFTGVALMIFAALSWVVLAIIAVAFGGRRRGSFGGGGGGGFSGGFSGGGGASGSW